MREIKCVFSTDKLVEGVFVRSETTRYYRDDITSNFDIIHDYLKMLWGTRLEIAFIDVAVYVNGDRASKPAEFRLKGMIDTTLLQADGSIPMTKLQMSVLLDKVKSIKKAARGSQSGDTEE